MVATTNEDHSGHLVSDLPRKGERLLRAAAFYGANGAGKSNFVQAMQFAKNLIVNGTRGTQLIGIRPFRLGIGSSRPCKFEFVFEAENILYNYGFRVDSMRVHEEWLFATHDANELPYFQRYILPDGNEKIEYGSLFTENDEKQEQFLEFVAKGTRPNQLFLTEALDRNVVKLKPIVDWFQKSLIFILPESSATHLDMIMHEDKSMTSFMEDILRVTGTGVNSVETEEVPFDFDNLSSVVLDAFKDQVKAQLEASYAVTVNLYGPQEESVTLKHNTQNQIVRVLLHLLHQGKNGHQVAFGIDEESDGTQRLLNLIPALFMLKQNPGQVLVVDELDRRLHPHLSRFFIKAALDCGDAKSCKSQLIFTAHDTNLLDLELLRRDEIWFAEKDKNGASHIYSLAEFNWPATQSEKGYLNGRFGAIPFIGDVSRLHENDVLERSAGEADFVGAAA